MGPISVLWEEPKEKVASVKYFILHSVCILAVSLHLLLHFPGGTTDIFSLKGIGSLPSLQNCGEEVMQLPVWSVKPLYKALHWFSSALRVKYQASVLRILSYMFSFIAMIRPTNLDGTTLYNKAKQVYKCLKVQVLRLLFWSIWSNTANNIYNKFYSFYFHSHWNDASVLFQSVCKSATLHLTPFKCLNIETLYERCAISLHHLINSEIE